MKTPIEVKDIRKGDLIRIENDNLSWAVEFRATHDCDRSYPGRTRRYLLDHPTPPVELPTERTSGWVETRGGKRRYVHDVFWNATLYTPSVGEPRRLYCNILGSGLDSTDVTAFTPAVAVPVAALDELRGDNDRAHDSGSYERGFNIAHNAITRFLAAVDEANRA